MCPIRAAHLNGFKCRDNIEPNQFIEAIPHVHYGKEEKIRRLILGGLTER